MAGIAFENIPSDLRVPLMYAELGSGGTPFDSAERLLLIGQKLASGTAPLNQPVLVSNATLIEEAMFGPGSMLSDMVKTARANAPFQEIWALPVSDATGATAAAASINYNPATLPVTVTTTATAYVAGAEYNVVVTAASTAATIATAMAAEINADTRAPVVADGTTTAGVVALTAKQVGTLGNDIAVTKDQVGDESVLTSESVITAMTGGAGDPDITAGLAALGDEDFLWPVMPYADAANLAAMDAFMDDNSGRWSPLQQLYGHALSVKYQTVANLSTLGATLNNQHLTVVGVYGMPSAPWVFAAALGAKVAQHLSDAPELSRPLQFIELEGVVAPKIADRFSLVDRNTLYYDGIASVRYDRTGAVQIERLITTYRTNAAGVADSTFLDIQTMAQAQYVLRYLRTKVISRHGRHALAEDNAPPINGVVRPRDIRNTLIAGYAELADLAVVENIEAFEAALIVERNATDANRVDVLLPFDSVQQLRVLAVKAVANLQL